MNNLELKYKAAKQLALRLYKQLNPARGPDDYGHDDRSETYVDILIDEIYCALKNKK